MEEKLWTSNYIKVMAANLLLFFAFYLLTPLLPLYLAETFGAGNDQIGLVLSGYTIAAMLSRPLSGFLVDTYPRKRVLMVVFLLFFLCFAGYAAASSILLFAILRTLHGAPFGALTVANSTVAIDVLPTSRRNEGIGLYGLSNNLAMAIAPTVGIFVYQYIHDFRLLFWMAFLIAGLGMAVDATVRLRPRPRVEKKRPLSWDRFFLLRGWLLGVNMVFFGLAFGVLSNYLAIYSKNVMGITGGTGVYFMLLSAGLILSRLQGRRSLRQGKLTRHALQGIIISTIGYLLFVALPNEWGYYLSAVLIGLGNGHFWPAFQNMIIQAAHHNERGTANSTILVSWDVGMGIGILLGGFVSHHFSYSAAFWMVGIEHILGLLLFIFFTRKSFRRARAIVERESALETNINLR